MGCRMLALGEPCPWHHADWLRRWQSIHFHLVHTVATCKPIRRSLCCGGSAGAAMGAVARLATPEGFLPPSFPVIQPTTITPNTHGVAGVGRRAFVALVGGIARGTRGVVLSRTRCGGAACGHAASAATWATVRVPDPQRQILWIGTHFAARKPKAKHSSAATQLQRGASIDEEKSCDQKERPTLEKEGCTVHLLAGLPSGLAAPTRRTVAHTTTVWTASTRSTASCCPASCCPASCCCCSCCWCWWRWRLWQQPWASIAAQASHGQGRQRHTQPAQPARRLRG